MGGTGWCEGQESCRRTRALSSGRQRASRDCWDQHCRLAPGSGCVLTQDLAYSGVRESLSDRCHLPPVNLPGCPLSRCLFTPACEGLVTHSHYGNCSMWLVSQEGSQPRHGLRVKEEVGEISTQLYLIWLYSLITINLKMSSFNSTAGLPWGPRYHINYLKISGWIIVVTTSKTGLAQQFFDTWAWALGCFPMFLIHGVSY